MNSQRIAPPRDPQFVATLANGVAILMAFTPGEASLANRDLSLRTGLSRPTVSRLTQTLMAMGYLRLHAASGRYMLGAATLSLGYPLIAGLKVRQSARPLMRELAEQFEGVVSLAMRDRTRMIYLDAVLAEHSRISMRELGSDVTIMGTAIGRAWLAVATPAERTQVLNQISIKDAAQYNSYIATLAAALAGFERNGYATNSGVGTGAYGFAVPLQGSPGQQRIIFSCRVSHHLGHFRSVERAVAPLLVNLVRSVEISSGPR